MIRRRHGNEAGGLPCRPGREASRERRSEAPRAGRGGSGLQGGVGEHPAVLAEGSWWRRLSVCLRAYCRTRRSSLRPPWESPAATAQPAPAGPPVLGHLLEAQR
ncbi:unnamed protein product [Rangifer tarandus platyrhynchus]|uniref:Uncharacterized protein n=1 Tax=Rangifer tarandus platyrhynchus TaxID=3082113 RepID=A0AC59ZRC5_RANTA